MAGSREADAELYYAVGVVLDPVVGFGGLLEGVDGVQQTVALQAAFAHQLQAVSSTRRSSHSGWSRDGVSHTGMLLRTVTRDGSPLECSRCFTTGC